MRERGFRAALRFYRAHFLSVATLSLVFYVALIVLAVASIAELGWYAILAISYLLVASIFWLQAPLAQFMNDVRTGYPKAGIRRTFEALYPRMGSITGGSFLAAVAVMLGFYFFLVPGLFLLARWALLIPVIVIERVGAFRAFRRSNELVARHTVRVIVELIISGVVLIVLWSVAAELTPQSGSLVSAVVLLVFLAVTTPPIPLMRVLSYYDLLEAEAKREPPFSESFGAPP